MAIASHEGEPRACRELRTTDPNAAAAAPPRNDDVVARRAPFERSPLRVVDANRAACLGMLPVWSLAILSRRAEHYGYA